MDSERGLTSDVGLWVILSCNMHMRSDSMCTHDGQDVGGAVIEVMQPNVGVAYVRVTAGACMTAKIEHYAGLVICPKATQQAKEPILRNCMPSRDVSACTLERSPAS